MYYEVFKVVFTGRSLICLCSWAYERREAADSPALVRSYEICRPCIYPKSPCSYMVDVYTIYLGDPLDYFQAAFTPYETTGGLVNLASHKNENPMSETHVTQSLQLPTCSDALRFRFIVQLRTVATQFCSWANVQLGTAAILAVGPIKETLLLGTAGTRCPWALQIYYAV